MLDSHTPQEGNLVDRRVCVLVSPSATVIGRSTSREVVSDWRGWRMRMSFSFAGEVRALIIRSRRPLRRRHVQRQQHCEESQFLRL